MFRLSSKNNHLISRAVIFTAALAGLAGTANATIFVRPITWFNPSGAASAPYSNFAAATCKATVGETVQIQQGTFPDTFTLSKPVTLTTTSGDVATIGTRGSTVIPFKVYCFNLHLFGDVVPFTPVWQDGNRAGAIGGLTNSLRLNGVDVIGYQEVWDPDYWDVIRAVGLYPHGGYGGRRDSGSTQNSGLAIFSLHPLSGGTQISYDDENGLDASASKGYLRQTLVKDGVTIGIWVTHTQSGEGSGDETTRQSQMTQLATEVSAFRALLPHSPVFVLGDFNVKGETFEHSVNMSNAMGGLASLADVATNLGSCNGDSTACTTCSDNDLREYFNGVKAGTRLDYIMYANSLDGSVRIVPKVYDVQRPLAPNTISGSGFATENGGVKSMSSRMLSDHDAIYAEFEIHKD